MKRLITITITAAVVLLLMSATHGRKPVRHGAPAVPSHSPSSEPAEVARTDLTALLAGELSLAEANSTPLLAKQLASQQPRKGSVDDVPAFDLLTLDQAATAADLAVELHWPDGRIAALRVQLNRLEGRWLVSGVQP